MDRLRGLVMFELRFGWGKGLARVSVNVRVGFGFGVKHRM